MAPLLAGYLMFGFGYIGYMTFIVTLLRDPGLSPGRVAAFFGLLGAGAVASSWIWVKGATAAAAAVACGVRSAVRRTGSP